MKKLMLCCLCAAAGLSGVFGLSAARPDVGPNDDDDGDYGYQPRYRHRQYRESRDEGYYAHCRPERVYVVERDCPVRRDVYFDPAGRCFYPVGPRRVYVESYYREYPRFHRRRPHVSVGFNFGG